MRVHVDPRKLAELMRDEGSVGRPLLEAGQEVLDGATTQVGVSDDSARGGKHLRDSLVKRLIVEGDRLVCLVGSDEPHAWLHHEGTDPHVIVPVTASVLVFNVGGRTVYAMRVEHPGTAPNRYLTDSARRAGLRVVEAA